MTGCRRSLAEKEIPDHKHIMISPSPASSAAASVTGW